MRIEVELRSHVPIYVQIIDQVKQQIASGELLPGDQLPTVRQLAADLRVNFNTIARAYRVLDEEGVISTQQGRGTYILEPPSAENGERRRQEALERLTNQYLIDAHQLGISPEVLRTMLAARLDDWEGSGQPPDWHG